MSKIGNITLPTITTSVGGQSVTYANTQQEQLIFNKIGTQLDLISSGKIAGAWNAASAPPTGSVAPTVNAQPTALNTYGVGDYIRNSNPTVFVGSNGKQWITKGWICTVAGSVGTANPPTFVPDNSCINP
jgi:hypothetical protein